MSGGETLVGGTSPLVTRQVTVRGAEPTVLTAHPSSPGTECPQAPNPAAAGMFRSIIQLKRFNAVQQPEGLFVFSLDL